MSCCTKEAQSRPYATAKASLYLCVIEDAPPIIGADHGKLALLTKVGSCYEFGLAVQLVPEGDFLVWNVPKSQLAIKGATQKVAVILRVITNEPFALVALASATLPGDGKRWP